MVIARRFHPVAEHIIHHPVCLIVNLAYLPFREHTVKQRTFLILKAIGRQMLGSQSKSTANVIRPFGDRLTGKSEHKIDRDIVDSYSPEPSHGPGHLRGIMTAAEKTQSYVGESLRSHRHSVHWGLTQCPAEIVGNILRITLHGNLHFTPIRRENIIDTIENAAYIRCRQLTWRTTTDINRRQTVRALVFPHRHLTAESPHVVVL